MIKLIQMNQRIIIKLIIFRHSEQLQYTNSKMHHDTKFVGKSERSKQYINRSDLEPFQKTKKVPNMPSMTNNQQEGSVLEIYKKYLRNKQKAKQQKSLVNSSDNTNDSNTNKTNKHEKTKQLDKYYAQNQISQLTELEGQVPPLLDLSFQSEQNQYKFFLKHQNRRKSTQRSSKTQNAVESIYIEENQQKYKNKAKTQTNRQTQNNTSIVYQLENDQEVLENTNHKITFKQHYYPWKTKTKRQLFDSSHFNYLMQESDLSRITVQTFANSLKNKELNDSRQSSLESVINFDKSASQILSTILTNKIKLQQYLDYLLQKSIFLKSQQIRWQGSSQQKLRLSNNEGLSTKKKNVDSHKTFQCFEPLVKINQASQKCGGLLPTVSIINRNENNKMHGQIMFNFGQIRNQSNHSRESLQSLRKFNLSKRENSDQQQAIKYKSPQIQNQTPNYQKNKQRIKQLEHRLAIQDKNLQTIAIEYEKIIHDYATTYLNLLLKQQNINNLKANNTKYPQDKPKKQGISSGGSVLAKNNEKLQEIKDGRRKKDIDLQLEELILNKSRIDPIAIFNRLSSDSKRKVKNNKERQQNYALQKQTKNYY